MVLSFIRHSNVWLAPFSCLWYKDMAHTHNVYPMKQTAEHHQWVIETDCRAECQHQGKQSDLARVRHFTISLSSWWSNQSDMVGKLTPSFLPLFRCFSSLIILQASWATSPSQLNVDDRLFNSSWMQMSHSLRDKQWCTVRLKVY